MGTGSSSEHTVTSEESLPEPRRTIELGHRTDSESGAWMTEAPTSGSLEGYAEYRIRIRTIVTISMLLWPSFIVVDGLVAWAHSEVRFWVLATLRGIGWLPIGFLALVLHRRWWDTYRQIKGLEAFTYFWANTSIGLMCLEFYGPSSPYSVGFLLVLMTRGLFLSEPWQKSIRWNLALGCIYPAVLLSGALISEDVARAFDAQGWVSFVMYEVFILTAVALMAVGSHSIWALRRQLYQARALGRYRLIRRLGRGGMGEVWRAHHPGLRRDVAIKISRADRADDPNFVERFRREVRAMTELTHPNSVRVFDYGSTEDGLVYYVMELLDGETLRDYVGRAGGRIPVRSAVQFLRQVTAAVAAAHEAGIIHRDIKPSNIFVSEPAGSEAFLRILDFGIAKFDRESEPTVTRVGTVVGTAAYMSPEVAAGQTATPASDVYALGMVLYFMLSGEPAFTGINQAEIMRAQLLDVPPDLQSRVSEVLSSALRALVEACLQKEPSLRPVSARALLERLDRLPEMGGAAYGGGRGRVPSRRVDARSG